MQEKTGRKVTGCFCSTNFADAFAKGTGHQLDFAEPKDDGDKRLNIYCMPCVVEIHPYDLVPTHMHGNKYCFEAAPGQGVLPGVLIKTIYINEKLLQNFLEHHISDFDLTDPQIARICGQSYERFTTPDIYQATCGRVLTWETVAHKSRSGICYCRSCTEYHVNGASAISLA